MSTNFYLYPKACEHCGRGDEPIHVYQTPSGFQSLKRWDDAADDEVTICGSWAEWRAYLALAVADGGIIRNEYDETFTVDEFTAYVESTDRAGRRRQHEWYRRNRPGDLRSGPSLDGVWLDPDGFTFMAGEFS